MGDIFQLVLLDPMINVLVILTRLLFGSFGLAIIAFTLIVRAVTFPLTLRQLHQTRAMQSLQPRMQEINKKYSDPKRRQQELMKAYREAGVNPLGCIGPMLIQMPILIALFLAVRQALAISPKALESLSGHLYPWSFVERAVPLEEHFLGIDLRHPNLILVALVGITTWAQSKTTITVATDDRSRAQQQMMTYMLPLMFTFFALSFPSGVSLYWVVNSIAGITLNIVTYGFPWLNIKPLVAPPKPAPPSEPEPEGPPPRTAARPSRESRTSHGSSRNKRQNRRRRAQ